MADRAPTGTSPAAYGRASRAMIARATKNTSTPLPSKALPERAGRPRSLEVCHHGRKQAARITSEAMRGQASPGTEGSAMHRQSALV